MNTMDFMKNEGESVLDYILRFADLKKSDKNITWQFIADCVEREFGLSRSESWVRKTVKDALGLSLGEEEDLLEKITEQKAAMDESYATMRKERYKLSDERTQVNALYRALSREETIKEIALLTAQEMSSKKILSTYNSKSVEDVDDDEAILCISDWHYGLDFENPWNKFSPEICEARVSKLLSETIKRIRKHKCKTLHLVNLGDLIAGRIHLGIRLQSRFDVISQTMKVSEILAEFITSLTKYVNVEYYDVIDNHSRLEPNKKDAMDLETLARIIPWYLNTRLKDNVRFTLHENTFGCDLSTFSVMDYNVIGVHGDKDKPINVIDRLQAHTRSHYDLVLMAHRHHMSMDESSGTLLVCNGSLMGTDDYASNLRLNSPSSQNLIICNKDSIMSTFYRIELDKI